MPNTWLDNPLKLLIVEDHEFTRTGLKYSLQGYYNLTVVGEAGDGNTAIELAKNLQPDMILMDIGMPKMDGISATQEIKRLLPDIKIIMLTSRQLSEEIYAAMASGADAYCMKDITTERLMQMLEAVYGGAVWLDPAIARIVANALPGSSGKQITQDSSPPQTMTPTNNGQTNSRPPYQVDLTEREREVLFYIAKGMANKDIADDLSLSIHTVKTHVRNLIQKLAVDDRTQAALKAVQEGLV